jgi:hypothetical protein
MRRPKATEIWENFLGVYQDSENLLDFQRYYSSITTWIMSHGSVLGQDNLVRNEIHMLVNLDPSVYVIPHPPLDLAREAARMRMSSPDTLDSICMVLRGTLWDMVTAAADQECSVCENDDMRYVLSKDDTKERLLIECQLCGNCQDLKGNGVSEVGPEFYPASPVDLARWGISS